MTLLEQRPAGLSRSHACDALGLARTGTYPRPPRPRPRKAPPAQPRQLCEAEQQALLDLLHSEPYQDQSVRVVHARELNAGRMCASVSTMYRLVRRAQESGERRPQRPAQRHAVPRITARAPNEAWTWDITKLPTTTPRRYLNLYQILDLFSRYPIAWMVSRKENAALARHLFAQAFDAYAIAPGALIVHQDRGAPMIAHSYRELLEAFGVRRSYSRPRVSNDNPFSESQFKTLKYSPGYPGRFEDIEQARSWVGEFIHSYRHRPHEGLAFYTPDDVFHHRVEAVYARRQQALDTYYAAHPERFPRGQPITKRPPARVSINPDDGITITAENLMNDPDTGDYAYPPITTTIAEKMN